ncbi:hypothetical protein KP509_06G089500 [Ceratopteris richardii]|uniref:Uncharacterized protein n=1 Tax=Ceratopteris richardii TaxID=49495 RepID=A0A8T2UQ60_CERRI|nr:hypothetical protein KP509_06G089500 [Ceratopteris richardii]
MAEPEVEDKDLQTIRDVLSVHHVPVVASLHWDKLHSVLHSLCDQIATQASRLEKAEEQGKNFLVLKDELGQLCQNAVKEMRDAKEAEAEQQQRWSQTVEERLQALQQGINANATNIKRIDALEEASKKLDRLDALEEATKNLEAIQASHPISLDTLNQKIEELAVEFEEQSEKLHLLEEQNERMKAQLDQMRKTTASDMEALQQYCRNLRSDFELKFLVDVGKLPSTTEGEVSPSSKAKLEAAVAELQNRMQKKADVDELEKISQSTQLVKDAFENIQSNVIELQSQFRRLSAGSRRVSRVSFSAGLGSQDFQVPFADSKLSTIDELSPKLVDELTKDVKLAIEKHDKELLKVQRDFGLVGKSILILSGHLHDYLRLASIKDPAEKMVKVLEGLGEEVPIVLPADSITNKRSSRLLSGSISGATINEHLQLSNTSPSARLSSLGTLDQMDNNSTFEAISEALRTNKFEAKGSVKAIVKISEDVIKLFSRLDEFDTVVAALKEGLLLKADKLDVQKLARYVKEQLQRPENAIFTTKPLYGYRCMSCDHPVQKLSPTVGEHLPTNQMPPQVLPMLSAERIFGLDRRSSSGSGFYNSPQSKGWNGSYTGGYRQQRGVHSRRSTSPRKCPMH